MIDIGSNTVLLLVLERPGRVVLDKARITRLGEGMARGGPSEAARRRTAAAVAEFAAGARRARARPVVAVGTEAFRRARDGPELLARMRRAAELDGARILSGSEEAELAIEPWRLDGAEGVAVVDVGGGSTELAWTRRDRGVAGVSLPIGSVRLTEALMPRDPPGARDLAAVRESVVREIESSGMGGAAAELGPDGRVIAVAGTATTLAALDQSLDPYDPERVEGAVLDRERVEAWVDRLASMTLSERCRLRGMEPGRADVIVAGLVILSECLAALGRGPFITSGRGLRYGVALRLLEDPRAVW